jgi:cytochrome c553
MSPRTAQNEEGDPVMLKCLLSPVPVLVAGIAFASPAAHAADEIEAKVQVCAKCHGLNGVSIDPKTIPAIWGQQQSYLMKQLRDFRTGERASPIMAPIAKDLAEGDLRKIAAYFAAREWPGRQAPVKPLTPPKGIEQCAACHQEDFRGGRPAPRLAGLNADYLIEAMRAFATGKRSNNLDMPSFMRRLSAPERSAIARYLAAL